MPWETTDAMDQKKRMIEQWQSGRYSKAELARRFGVIRTTVYEWIGRFSASGGGGLAERSRAPRSQPHKTSPDVVAQIVGLRSQLPHRGAKKLKAIWEREHSRRPWPAAQAPHVGARSVLHTAIGVVGQVRRRSSFRYRLLQRRQRQAGGQRSLQHPAHHLPRIGVQDHGQINDLGFQPHVGDVGHHLKVEARDRLAITSLPVWATTKW